MCMRKIAANYIFPADSVPIHNGFVEIDSKGTLTNFGKLERETPSTEFYNGIICIVPKANYNLSSMKDDLMELQTKHPEKALEEMVRTICKKYTDSSAPHSITPNKEIILIDSIDFQNMKITSESIIKRLI